MRSGVQLLMDMQLKCCTLKGTPSLSTGHCTQCLYAFSLGVHQEMQCIACLHDKLPALALMLCKTFWAMSP